MKPAAYDVLISALDKRSCSALSSYSQLAMLRLTALKPSLCHTCTVAGPEGGIPDSNIAAALALLDKVRPRGHAPQTCCVAEQLAQLSQSMNKSCKGVLHAMEAATHHAMQAGSQADIWEAARRGVELARTATPAGPSHAVSGEQSGDMRSPRHSVPVELTVSHFNSGLAQPGPSQTTSGSAFQAPASVWCAHMY